jgi:hypothetical protein
MAPDVFVSIGRTATRPQEAFAKAVERELIERQLRPRYGKWSSVQPLKAVEEVMDECAGAVIVAFERVFVESGLELRGSKANQKSLSDQGIPTVWNQIEATMAYTKGQPLLVLVEDGLRTEGLLEDRYDWTVQWLPLRPAALRSEGCSAIIDDWRRRVEAFEAKRKAVASAAGSQGGGDLSKRSIGELLAELKPGQAWALLTVIVTGLVALAGTAFALGAKFG